MKKYFILKILVIMCLTSGCSHDAVTGVKLNENGDLIITKCESKYLTAIYLMFSWTSSCRDEVKPKPIFLAS